MRIPFLKEIKSSFKWISRKTQKWSPPGFGGFSVHQVVKHLVRHNNIPDISEKAAAISYNFIMSIPPTCLFIFTLIPVLPLVSRNTIKLQLHSLIFEVIPSETYNKGLVTFVDGFIDGSKIGLISFSFVISLFFASNGVMGLMRSFNRTGYEGFKEYKGLRERWGAIKLTLMLFALLTGTIILLFLQSNVLEWLGIRNLLIGRVILLGRWFLMGALIFFSYAFVYRYAPSTISRWKLISPGAIFATALSIIVTLGFSYFVGNFGRYNFLYGSIGTIMVIMSMIFLNSFVASLGFRLNLSIHLLSNEKERKISKRQKME